MSLLLVHHSCERLPVACCNLVNLAALPAPATTQQHPCMYM